MINRRTFLLASASAIVFPKSLAERFMPLGQTGHFGAYGVTEAPDVAAFVGDTSWVPIGIQCHLVGPRVSGTLCATEDSDGFSFH